MPSYTIAPLIYFRERFRSATRQILIIIAAFTGLFIAMWRPQEGWTFFDYLLPSLIFAVPVGLAAWAVYRFIRFALGR